MTMHCVKFELREPSRSSSVRDDTRRGRLLDTPWRVIAAVKANGRVSCVCAKCCIRCPYESNARNYVCYRPYYVHLARLRRVVDIRVGQVRVSDQLHLSKLQSYSQMTIVERDRENKFRHLKKCVIEVVENSSIIKYNNKESNWSF